MSADGHALRAEVHVTSTADLHALPALLTVAETADVLRVARSWVYEHAAELGAVKLGTGRPRHST